MSEGAETSPNPEAATKSLHDQVHDAIQDIRPYLQGDGGDCELVSVDEDGTVQLKFVGACGGCPSSTMTLKMGIENHLKDRIPAVKQVIQVF